MIKHPIKACYVDEKGIDLDSGIVPFVLSERMVDHDSEVIEPEGIELGIFEKNPVFLWAHDMRGRPPIGRVMPESLKKTKQRLTGKVKFDIENDPFAAMVFQKYANGFLNAGSIRFIPTDFSDKAVLPGQKGATITKSILLEFSSVAVPANPAALAQKGFTDDLDADERGKEWLKELNDFYEDENFDHTPEGWIARMNKVDEKDETEETKVEAGGIKIYMDLHTAEDAIRNVIYEAMGKTVVSFKSYPLADESAFWDEKDVPFISKCFAWYDYEMVKGKFPHHAEIDDEIKTVWRGVAKAMVDLFKDDSLSDEQRKEVYEHLAKHYKEFDKEPPEFKDYSDEELTEISEKIVINFSDDDTDKIIKETIRLLKDEEPKE